MQRLCRGIAKEAGRLCLRRATLSLPAGEGSHLCTSPSRWSSHESPKDAEVSCATPRAIATKLFYSFGSSSKGDEVVLEASDVERMLHSMGIYVGAEKFQHMLSMADTDGDGVISEQEFVKAFDWLIMEGQDQRDYEAIFHTLDKDKDGFITAEELTCLHTTTKDGISLHEAGNIIAYADMNGDGVMSYEEFVELLGSYPSLAYKLLTTYRVVFVVGGPASGKGTVCAELMRRSNKVIHVSSGDLLRKEVQQGTPLGLKVADIMQRGELCDASTVLALLEKFLARSPGRCVLLDGFPRSLENAQDFHKMYGRAEGYLEFVCPDDEMARRIVTRGLVSGREDDNEETARRRIKVYRAATAGPLEFFKQVGVPGYQLNALEAPDANARYIMSLPMFKEHADITGSKASTSGTAFA
ncbi:unnamed protein product [Chrysoparadoxa australica]